MAQQEHHQSGISVLTLDGGGVRGLSTLHILKALMNSVNSLRAEQGLSRVKPYQIFHIIAGTGTGGLIAIMLGRLRMDAEECILAYEQLSKEVFNDSESLIGRATTLISGTVKPRFNSAKLESQILRIVGQRLDGEDPKTALLYDQSLGSTCKVPTIVEAALATSAATTFFDEVEIDGQVFVDGALGANNPANEAFREIRKIYGETPADAESRLKCFVSIGTGNIPGEFSDNVWELIRERMLSLVTETERTAEDFEKDHSELFKSGRAFRFNVHHGLEKASLDDHNQMSIIGAKIRIWINQTKQTNEIQGALELAKFGIGLWNYSLVWMKDFLHKMNDFLDKMQILLHIQSTDRWLAWIVVFPLVVGLLMIFLQLTGALSNAKLLQTFRMQPQLDGNLPIFAVIGATGVGKSSFIKTAGGLNFMSGEQPVIGETLVSETVNSQIYRFASKSQDGYLIDTPGIDESNRTRTDVEIMQTIHNQLDRLKKRDKLLMGLIFMYDISQPRAYGTVLKAMDTTADMIEHLLGSNGIAKLTLVTTKWTENPSREVRDREERRELHLRDNIWNWQLRCNSAIQRYDNKVFSIKTALHLTSSKSNLSIARLLLSHGASARVKDKRGQLPLHRAAAIGSVPLIELMVANRSPVNATDVAGLSPLHHGE
ncbi:uncharacterized protein KY384_002143 [Bacidia gigantensis]|uniref:uncharacterized protein n=1 Tax=Bacidia gigantensis TaxID=2732470 RepID=UPI001D057AD8|nr:uncharacterized protein KY384_002143 [Bacidia gigantensis]KAG8533360.1 hypothetical protein KY384_002143 [Bacidia gigantensis]